MAGLGGDMSPYKPVPLAERCQEDVPDGGRSVFFHRCLLRGTITENGKRWCSHHAPSLVAALRAKKLAEWGNKWVATQAANRKRAEEDRKLEAFPVLLAACEHALATLTVWPLPTNTPDRQIAAIAKKTEKSLRATIAKAKGE